MRSKLNQIFLEKHLVRRFLIFLILFAAICFVYWPVSNFDFLRGWDDQWFVTNHYTENGFSWENLSAIFTEFYYGQYAPVNQLYYTTLYRFFGYNTGYFHISSIFLHILNATLVYIFIKRLLFFKNDQQLKNIFLAFATSLLFAIMPINVEPVAWVAASKVLLYASFYLMAILAYQQYVLTYKSYFYYLAILSLLLSFGAKEQAVVFPFAMILLDFHYGRSLKQMNLWLEKLPIFILALLFGLATLDSQQVESRDFYHVSQRIPLVIFTYMEYLIKTVIPVNLSYLYPFPFLRHQSVPYWMWVETIVIPFVLYAYRDIWRNAFVLFGICFFTIHILLVCNVLSLARFSIIADRYTYIASIGICLLLAYMFTMIIFGTSKYRTQLLLLSMVYFISLLWTSKNHVSEFENVYTLKKRLKLTIEGRPDFKQLKENAQ